MHIQSGKNLSKCMQLNPSGKVSHFGSACMQQAAHVSDNHNSLRGRNLSGLCNASAPSMERLCSAAAPSFERHLPERRVIHVSNFSCLRLQQRRQS